MHKPSAHDLSAVLPRRTPARAIQSKLDPAGHWFASEFPGHLNPPLNGDRPSRRAIQNGGGHCTAPPDARTTDHRTDGHGYHRKLQRCVQQPIHLGEF